MKTRIFVFAIAGMFLISAISSISLAQNKETTKTPTKTEKHLSMKKMETQNNKTTQTTTGGKVVQKDKNKMKEKAKPIMESKNMHSNLVKKDNTMTKKESETTSKTVNHHKKPVNKNQMKDKETKSEVK